MTSTNDWERVIPKGNTPPFSIYNKPIQKSPQDDMNYRIITLENGMQATLVHDPKADKAAASLDVAVGHLYDPDDMPGLAHFCEHLLFMGTEKFPRENEYSEYLAKNNGMSNAYTSTSNTNYYFSVSTNALPGALERFAAFFHCPLFNSSCTSRELNAVDSEHKKNHQADMWRIFQLNKHLSHPGHVWSKFGSGNRESLSRAAKALKAKGKLLDAGQAPRDVSLAPSPIPSRISSPAPSVSSNTSEAEADGGAVGRETRRRLVEWWSREYCASRMRLCVIGNESLDTLAEMTSTLFSPVLNRGRDPLPMITEHPFGPNEECTLVSVQTIMKFHALEISFPLEYQAPLWQQKPSHFISHFVGHEGPGSLYSYLKNKGWVTSISCGPQNLARGFGMFKITAYLTQEGFLHYRDVILASFKYLSLLRSSEFAPFHQRELVDISAIRFRFAEKRRPDDYASWISEQMAWPVPRELLLSAPQLTWDWEQGSEAKVRDYLDQFRIDRGRVVLMAKAEDHMKLTGNAQWDREPWYGTEYHVKKFDAQFVELANGPNDILELFLPGPNEFIPTNFEVEKWHVAESLKRPHLIRETPLSTLWHKKDDRFWVPKAHVMIDFRSPAANTSARASVLSKLFADIVTDSLTEYSYDADLAGLTYNLLPHTTGLFVSMHGYNDKMEVLVRHIQEKLKNIVVRPDRLAIMKELAKREWDNFLLGQSYTISDYYGRYMLAENQWTVEEKLQELPSVTADEIEVHIKELLSQVNLRILVAGNINKAEAIRLAELTEIGLGASSLPPVELNGRALVLPKGSNFVWSSPLPNLNQPNSSLTYYLHYGPVTDQRLRVVSALLTQILTEPAFNVLRTQEQLGYIVSCSGWSLPGASERGLRIVVQSEKQPWYLEERVEAFLDGMRGTIEAMSATEFEQQKLGLERKWLEADKNLGDEVGRFMNQIHSGHWDFLRNENDATLLRRVTKEDVLAVFLAYIHPSSATRSKLSVHICSQKLPPLRVSAAATQAFRTLLQASVPQLREDVWENAPVGDDNPLLLEFSKYWSDALAGTGNIEELITALSELVKKYPAPGEEQSRGQSKATIIPDIKVFKASLTRGANPGPLVDWKDLPESKY